MGFIRDAGYIRNLISPFIAVLCMAAAVFGVGMLPLPTISGLGGSAFLLLVKGVVGAIVFGAVLRLCFWGEVKELIRGPKPSSSVYGPL